MGTISRSLTTSLSLNYCLEVIRKGLANRFGGGWRRDGNGSGIYWNYIERGKQMGWLDREGFSHTCVVCFNVQEDSSEGLTRVYGYQCEHWDKDIVTPVVESLWGSHAQ